MSAPLTGWAAWRRSLAIGGGLTVVLMLIGTIGYLTADQPAPRVPPEPVVVVEAVPGGIAAVSDSHGPRDHHDGRSAGFAHDELGAAIAASNLTARVSPAAGDVAKAAVIEQCFGDIPTTLARLRSALPMSDSPSRAALQPQALHYRVLAGDPHGDAVVVSLLAETPQARDLGGLSRIDATLSWIDGDWRLRVPLPAPSIHPSTEGYTLLGRTS
ncbi:hypothetical protein [Pseudonocardia sp. MH-G8]|uniref:hypothetical protein n=1 Tax=Pseudonocardia sp. MH-G8 TaxID=1854588 RepID=UPI000B9FBF8A|nr:hypothetical protein [Pseudonocardia sp. MH-G8]OZM77060.1 hypothetical protein CFP66_37355 [Pseudonocardia sp. MH-G8]